MTEPTHAAPWRFASLAALLGAWMLLSPHLRDHWLMQVLLQLALINFVVVVIWANPRGGSMGRWLIALWVVASLGAAATFFATGEHWRRLARTAESISMLPLLVLLAVGILRYVFRHRRLDTDGIFATVAAYLLIALTFASIFGVLELWVPGSFDLPVAAELRSAQQLRADFLYFSFVTLATVGYGDILPVSETARSLTVIEAVIGQFYIAVVVAAFVGMYAARRHET